MSELHPATTSVISPFRYPGGKTWLVPRIKQWLVSWAQQHGARPEVFIEPFAGGGSASLAVLAAELAGRAAMTEIDDEIASVWQTILDGAQDTNVTWLSSMILGFDVTPESVHDLLSRPASDRRARAFQTIVKNRVRSGGILAAGAGLLKRGENDRGLKSRWYPDTLVRRITAIARLRDRIDFTHGDGFDTIRHNRARTDAVLFLDPPYSAGGKNAGRRLYTHWQIDHQLLFALLDGVHPDFLLSYSANDEVFALAAKHGFDTLKVSMRNARHAIMTELLIGRNLDWARAEEPEFTRHSQDALNPMEA